MKRIASLLVFLVLVNCRENTKSDPVPIVSDAWQETVQDKDTHPGKRVLETECYQCHNPKASQEAMIAPPMVAIKRHYIDSNTTKETFTEDLIRWMNDPEQETKMPVAHKQFGTMPYMPYPEDALAQVAAYLYDYDIEKPTWYDGRYQEQYGKHKGKNKGMGMAAKRAQARYTKMGLDYASAAKSQLGSNLMKAVQEKGTVGAIGFCHNEATGLTDSVSIMNNAVIKRVSDKPRNPKNKASSEELGYIDSFKKALATGGEVEPIVNTVEGEVHFYYPITTNAMCLQCHGTPDEQIAPATMATLKKLYPKDLAVGYDVNQVRGIWSIVFDENNP